MLTGLPVSACFEILLSPHNSQPGPSGAVAPLMALHFQPAMASFTESFLPILSSIYLSNPT